MANRLPTPAWSESELTNTTPAGFQSPYDDQQQMSKAAMKELVAQQVEPLWKSLGDAMKERAEMKLRIDALEASETNLKNQLENVALNNEQLVDDVEKTRIENAGLRRTLNKMEIAGQFQRPTTAHELEKAPDFNLKNEKKEKKKRNQGRAAEKRDIKRKNEELEMMRNELGELGGAGYFWGNDIDTSRGGERDQMGEEELKKVLQLLAAGEKKINLKEREFRAFLSEKTERNSKTPKKSFGLVTIGTSRRLDGRSSSRLLCTEKEMEKFSISGSNKKPDAPNSRRLRSKFMAGMEKRRTGASCKAKRTALDSGSNINTFLVVVLLSAST